MFEVSMRLGHTRSGITSLFTRHIGQIYRALYLELLHLFKKNDTEHKKEQNWVICRDVDEPRVCHTEYSKSERKKQILMHVSPC